MALALAVSAAKATGTNGTTISPTYSPVTSAGNMLLLAVAVVGTSPTITTPAGWTQIQKVSGATLTAALYYQQNNAGSVGAVAVTLGGTLTGEGAAVFEFTGQGSDPSNQTLLGSNVLNGTGTALANIFPVGEMEQTNELFVYFVARATAAITTANSGLAWSATQQNISANGVAMDFYWATNLGPGSFPTAGGTLASSVAYVQIGARFDSFLGNVINFTNIGGNAGVGPQFFQGMVGG